MTTVKEFLRESIESLEAQQKAHAEAVQQAIGAIAMAKEALAFLEKQEGLTPKEFAKMVANAEIVENE